MIYLLYGTLDVLITDYINKIIAKYKINDLNISKYNVIDLDSYSNPLDLIDYLYPISKEGTVFFYTLIINPLNGGPRQLNIIDNQHEKCRSIGNSFLDDSWKNYLYKKGIKRYKEYVFRDSAMIKRYGTFKKTDW